MTGNSDYSIKVIDIKKGRILEKKQLHWNEIIGIDKIEYKEE